METSYQDVIAIRTGLPIPREMGSGKRTAVCLGD